MRTGLPALVLLAAASAALCGRAASAANAVTAANPTEAATSPIKVSATRDAYFGDLHLHTSYSLDAYLIGATKVDPDVAYRFAEGETINYLGEAVRRRAPLDFLAVTDHAENLGVLAELDDPNSAVSQSVAGAQLRTRLTAATGADGRRDLSAADWADDLWRELFAGRHDEAPEVFKSASKSAWAREIEFANRHYRPGKFTTFIAYEWTAQPNASNLHRNVIFRGGSAPNPFTALDSKDPRDLWAWLESIRRAGYEALAIPHNGNASNGLMYDWVSANESMDVAYARARQANEPLSEISQSKGQSETHPLLSPSDEFASFEIYDFLESARLQTGRPQGSYLRDALGAGLALERRLGANPFKYGFVGGSDLHSGLSVSAPEDYDGSHWTANLGGGKPSRDEVAALGGGSGAAGAQGESTPLRARSMSGNLTGVWAESNTRESIYGALRRRETFATTGSRLRFRFFAAWDFPRALMRRRQWVAYAYAKGVPMGGDLPPRPGDAATPSFAVWAVKDPDGAALERVQVIKVWEEKGAHQERIYDVCRNPAGAVELAAVWRDPDFDPHRYAAYYLRVLEVPTPRWSTLLAGKYGVPAPTSVPASEQQRGWSSPIWYSPGAL